MGFPYGRNSVRSKEGFNAVLLGHSMMIMTMEQNYDSRAGCPALYARLIQTILNGVEGSRKGKGKGVGNATTPLW